MSKNREWIIDADMCRDGLLAFCPIERGGDGEVTCVVTGITFLGATPPNNERCIGVWSSEGEEVAADFFNAHKEQLRAVIPEASA